MLSNAKAGEIIAELLGAAAQCEGFHLLGLALYRYTEYSPFAPHSRYKKPRALATSWREHDDLEAAIARRQESAGAPKRTGRLRGDCRDLSISSLLAHEVAPDVAENHRN